MPTYHRAMSRKKLTGRPKLRPVTLAYEASGSEQKLSLKENSITTETKRKTQIILLSDASKKKWLMIKEKHDSI